MSPFPVVLSVSAPPNAEEGEANDGDATMADEEAAEGEAAAPEEPPQDMDCD